MYSTTSRISRYVIGGLSGLILTLAGGMSGLAHADTVDLARTPPDLNRSVDPNIVVTFDDSGSMASNYMGDRRPFDDGGWGSDRWRCAATIDDRVTDPNDLRSHAMNGVYYNPNVYYAPPVKADGTSMPNADATLTNVWNDGIRKNRPRNSGNPGTTNFLQGSDANSYWYCGGGGSGKSMAPSGGPYYFRLKSSVNPGTLASPDTSVLYDWHNWEPVVVVNAPVTIDGHATTTWQNWANWWAYYRTRNLMTRTALSRVFGGLGGNIRVAWQNINDSDFKLPGSSIIAALLDRPGCGSGSIDPKGTQRSGGVTTAPNCYRSAFFNWIFETGASGSTPDRASTIRAGEFFERPDTGNLLDPYWNGNTDPVDSKDLTCRQNFHMLVTDGYWNEGNPTLPSGFWDAESTHTLPDGRSYSPSGQQTKIYWNVAGSTYTSSLANIAFNYWAQDLRPDLDDKVPPYIKDKTTGVTGSTPFDPAAAPPANDPLNNSEIYFNPVNDPATWQHVVQFMVTLGVAGNLQFPGDYPGLRLGTTGWPRPVNNAPEAIDDTWHAAVNSRGSYFSANNPSELVTHLAEIINSIAARGGSSSLGSSNTSTIRPGSFVYNAGYDSSANWSGSVTAQHLKPDGTLDPNELPVWDAACSLTGGFCATTHVNTGAARPPADRDILTSTDGTAGSGVPFQWADIGPSNQDALNDGDGLGQKRLDYLRGDRTQETATPLMRHRDSVLGAILRSQVKYLAAPESGFRDEFPAGSPEQAAVASNSYEKFAHDNADRTAMLYVGANDGMLHAFNAATGKEAFAYVPHALYWRKPPTNPANPATGEPLLPTLTDPDFIFTPTVDSTPVTGDVFFGGKWHTILVGGLGLGGRGVYALDVTDPDSIDESSASATKTVLWEFDAHMAATGAGDPSHLGYTFGTPNIGRLANGKWVVLVSGGYFPDCNSLTTIVPCNSVASQNNNFSSLFVLDAETGQLIKELRTDNADVGAGVASYGLGPAVLGDYQSDQIDDVAFAGDLVGNVWRFDLSDPSVSNWSVDLVYEAAPSDEQPITTMPRLFPDPYTGYFTVVFGTGRYLGANDRTLNSLPVQGMFGVREMGASTAAGYPGGSYYPVIKSTLVQQTLADANGDGVRTVTKNPVPLKDGAGNFVKGWEVDLGIVVGERIVAQPSALFSLGLVVFPSLIPGGNDPCDPGREGSILLLDAATGGPSDALNDLAASLGANEGVAGVKAKNVPAFGTLPIVSNVGGGGLTIPAINAVVGGSSQAVRLPSPLYHRGSWRVLNDAQ